jgi:hypothetical protein
MVFPHSLIKEGMEPQTRIYYWSDPSSRGNGYVQDPIRPGLRARLPLSVLCYNFFQISCLVDGSSVSRSLDELED